MQGPSGKLNTMRNIQYNTQIGGAKTDQTVDYLYDQNGNLTQDKNKAIPEGGINYNHLNLPVSVVVYSDAGAVRSVLYQYDAAGNKLKKTVNEPGQTAKVTTYRLGSVYENDVLQFAAQPEGRFRVVPATQTVPASIAFDYFLKDHLGNVRMVLTSETKTDQYPAATMETAQATTEEALYSNLPATRVAKPAGYPTDTYTNPNANVARVSGSGQKVGPSKLLKVMAGDKISFRVSSWYKTNGATPGTPSSLLSGLVNLVATAIGGLPATKGSYSDLISSNALNPGLTSFVNSTGTYTTSRPKAFVNWVLLDEQFNHVSSGSGFEQVGANNTFTVHQRTNLTMPASGYLYIYVSNETPNISVFFDNLQLTHVRGPLLEETHYYPFGLTMAGISSKALNGAVENKKGFQSQEFANKEFSDGSGIDGYEFKWRMHSPQIGRFWQVDPLSEKYVFNSTYAFSENKVTNHVELEGLEASPPFPYTNPMQPILEGFGQAATVFASWADRFSSSVSSTVAVGFNVFSNDAVKLDIEYSGSFSASYKPNFSSFMSTLQAGGTSENAPNAFDINFDFNRSVKPVLSVKAGLLEAENSFALDNKGVKTDETKVSGNFLVGRLPVVGSVSSSTNSKSEKTSEAQIGISIDPKKLLSLSSIPGASAKTTLGLGVTKSPGSNPAKSLSLNGEVSAGGSNYIKLNTSFIVTYQKK